MGNCEEANILELRRELDQLRGRYIDKDLPDKLFHYTDTAGLLGIIESQQLWATHRSYLNDATEINYTYDLVEKFQQILLDQNEVSSFTDENSPMWKLRDLLFRFSYRTLRLKPNPDIYISCFCENGDLLSQWRGYGANGSGHSIGFDGNQLKKNFSKYKLSKVVYSEDDQIEIIQQVFKATINSFEKLTKNMKVNEAGQLAETHAKIFEKEMLYYATFFKHPTFSEENEWRLVIMQDEKCQSEKIDFRASQRGIIPFIKISSDTDRELPISKIIIGPTEHKLFAKKAVEMATASKYPKLGINNSKIPLQ